MIHIRPPGLIKVLVIGLCYGVFSGSSLAQSTTSPLPKMEVFEIELLKIIDQITRAADNAEQQELNTELINKIEEAFKDMNAMNYPFDKLYAISDLRNSTGDLRIFTWELAVDNNIKHYYGVLCYSTDNVIYTYVLSDSSQSISDPEYAGLNNERWYGALYYGIKEFKYKRERHIVLLGINRSDDLIKERIIEIIDLGEDVRFGKEVFVFPDQTIGLKRKIYRYSVEADMTIWFEKDKKLILMDHLSPLKPMYEGKFEYYAPDLSFDALKYKKGKWYYEGDYDARMEKTENDRYFEMKLPKQEKIY